MSSSAGTSGGSPPHTRGRCGFTVDFNPNQRFTPAYAGKIVSWREGVPCREVHPRIRGEDCFLVSLAGSCQGSPPHTRGRSRLRPRGTAPCRFTPAYAGKIRFRNAGRTRTKVHPRIRGEDHQASQVVRFTPAYAGKIGYIRECYTAKRVHPRIRGEDLIMFQGVISRLGSPPHTRGRS